MYSTQTEVFENTINPIVKEVLQVIFIIIIYYYQYINCDIKFVKGYNCTVFAYGQTVIIIYILIQLKYSFNN